MPRKNRKELSKQGLSILNDPKKPLSSTIYALLLHNAHTKLTLSTWLYPYLYQDRLLGFQEIRRKKKVFRLYKNKIHPSVNEYINLFYEKGWLLSKKELSTGGRPSKRYKATLRPYFEYLFKKDILLLKRHKKRIRNMFDDLDLIEKSFKEGVFNFDKDYPRNLSDLESHYLGKHYESIRPFEERSYPKKFIGVLKMINEIVKENLFHRVNDCLSSKKFNVKDLKIDLEVIFLIYEGFELKIFRRYLESRLDSSDKKKKDILKFIERRDMKQVEEIMKSFSRYKTSIANLAGEI